MNIIMWQIPYSGFKVKSFADAQTFKKKCLVENMEYVIPDVDSSGHYYIINREDSADFALIGHGEYGKPFEPLFTHMDSDGRFLYRARKSINNYFFSDGE